MSNTDGFIEEVSEEVRKDHLFGLYKKYGWIAISAVVLLVGGAAFLEWQKASARSEAQARGDALVTALNVDDASERAEALAGLAANGGAEQPLATMLEAGVQLEQGNKDAALALFDKLAAGNDELYAEMAKLKAVMLRGKDMDMDARLAELDNLATAGRPFRTLALEQKAVALMDAGKTDEAIASFTSLLSEEGISSDLRTRASQLIIALGGELPEQTQLLSSGETAQ